MKNENRPIEISRVTDPNDKSNTYKVNMLRYNRAMKAECYIEALMIVYACLDDRLRYMLYHLGLLVRPDENRVGGRQTKNAFNNIMNTYMVAGNRRIRDISGKRNYVKSVFLFLAEQNEPESADAVRSILWCALHGDKRVAEVLELLVKIENWCAYRNDVVHALMDKNIESLDEHLPEQAQLGKSLFRKLDDMVRWVGRKNIPQRINMAYCREKQFKKTRGVK